MCGAHPIIHNSMICPQNKMNRRKTKKKRKIEQIVLAFRCDSMGATEANPIDENHYTSDDDSVDDIGASRLLWHHSWRASNCCFTQNSVDKRLVDQSKPRVQIECDIAINSVGLTYHVRTLVFYGQIVICMQCTHCLYKQFRCSTRGTASLLTRKSSARNLSN